MACCVRCRSHASTIRVAYSTGIGRLLLFYILPYML